jgi:hypothetical protein
VLAACGVALLGAEDEQAGDDDDGDAVTIEKEAEAGKDKPKVAMTSTNARVGNANSSRLAICPLLRLVQKNRTNSPTAVATNVALILMVRRRSPVDGAFKMDQRKTTSRIDATTARM